MAQGNPMPGEQYLHFKNKRYQVITVAYHSETKERYVVYQALYGDFRTYVRPYDMFVSEVDHEKYPDVKQKYRFQYLGVPSYEAPVKISEPVGNTEEVSAVESDGGPAGNETGAVEELKTENPEAKKEVVESGKEAEFAAPQELPEEGCLNPWLDKVLDAESFDEKYKIVCDMQGDITDRLIDDIAAVMDLAIPDGNLRERYAQLKYCLRTRQKYESGRLR